jgi:hypothetical protein
MNPALASSSWVLFFLASATLAGYLGLSWLCRGERKSPAEILGLSLALGSGGTGLLFLHLSLLGLRPTRPLVAGFCLLVWLATALARRRGRLLPVDFRVALRPGPAAGVLIGVTLLLVLVAGIHALAFPFLDWDAFAVWGLKAKVLFHESLGSRPAYFHDLSLSYSHLDYPLLVPMLVASEYALGGGVQETAGMLLFPFLFLALALVLHAGLRWKLEPVPAALLTALAMTTPVCLRWAGAGQADLALALFYAAALIQLARWVEEGRRSDLWLALLFSAFCLHTKNEGLGLALANVLVLAGLGFLRRDRNHWRAVGTFTLGLLALWLAWAWWSSDIPRTHEDYAARLRPATLWANRERLGPILSAFAGRIVAWNQWGLLWLLLGTATALGWRQARSRAVQVVWVLLALHGLMYGIAFLVTPWELQVLLDNSLDRLLLHLLPAVILLTGWHVRPESPPP